MAEGGEEGEVGYVLDASAIGALLERLGERGLRHLEGAVTLDLALYELGNILWKACHLRRVISEEEALEGARALTRVIELVERERLGGEDVEGVMALALSLSLTFYDASYLYLAKSRGERPLVPAPGGEESVDDRLLGPHLDLRLDVVVVARDDLEGVAAEGREDRGRPRAASRQ